MGLAGPASRGGAAGTLRPRGGRRSEPSYPSRLGAAVPRTLALQLGASLRERTGTDGFRRGARIDAAAPRRCAPAALLSICRCSHLPVNKSILQFNAAASRPPGTDAAAEPPPPSPLPSRAPAVRAGIPARQAAPSGASFASLWSHYKELPALGLSRGTERVPHRTGLRRVEERGRWGLTVGAGRMWLKIRCESPCEKQVGVGPGDGCGKTLSSEESA